SVQYSPLHTFELGFGRLDEPFSTRSLVDPPVDIVGRPLIGRLLFFVEPMHQPAQLTQRYIEPLGQFLRNLKFRERKTCEAVRVAPLAQVQPASRHAGAGEPIASVTVFRRTSVRLPWAIEPEWRQPNWGAPFAARFFARG